MKIPQPYFRQFDGWWYVQIRSGGKRKQFRLCQGREKKEQAIHAYYRLMASTPTAAPVSSLSVVAGLDTFLDHSIANAASATVELRRRYYESFGRFVGRGLLVSDLRPLHVNSWLKEQTTWSNTTRAIAIATIRRAFRWLRDEGYIKDYPLHGLKAPPRSRRETVISDAQYQKMLRVSDGPFAKAICSSVNRFPFMIQVLLSKMQSYKNLAFRLDQDSGEQVSRTYGPITALVL